MTTHFYRVGSPICIVCGHDKRTDIEGTLHSMEFCKPNKPSEAAARLHSCNITDTERNNGLLCRSMDCYKCKEVRMRIMACKVKFDEDVGILDSDKAEEYCGKERPIRKVLCQLKHPHAGSHRAIIYWED